MWTRSQQQQTPAASQAAAFVDEVVRQARGITPLVEFFRAHLEARAAGASHTAAEHVVDLLSLGVRGRSHARTIMRRPTARPDVDSASALMIKLRACGRSPAEVARMNAWIEFAFEECCPEALDEACDLAAWFELAADKALGQSAPGVEAQLELVRTEVVSRSLLERRTSAIRTPVPFPLRPAAAPKPGYRASAARSATSRLLDRATRAG
jgi:hypothetical protein